MRFPRKRGATSVMVRVFIPDNSVTTGAGCTGLTSGSTNLTIAAIRELSGTAVTYTGANIEAQTTIGTYQAPSTSSKVRFKPVDATNFPGLYELQFHDSAAVFDASDSSQNVIISVYEATTTALKIGPNMVMIPLSALTVLDGEANAVQWLGTACHAATVNGIPVVQLHNSAGTGGINAPANFEDLSVTDTTGLVACASTQKVDVETIKTQAVTCAAGVTVPSTISSLTAAGVLAQSLGTESYATTGNVPTLAQALFQLISMIAEVSVSGTTITCKKLDGSTTAMTFTINDGTNPTSRTRDP